MFAQVDGEIESLLERGYKYVESMFEESQRVDATALVETKEDIYIVTMPQVGVDADDEDARDAFRKAIEEIVEKHPPESITVITEIWWSVLPRLTESLRAPSRNLRHEGIVVHVELPGASRATMAEVSRWGDHGCVNEWREVSEAFVPGLTGFFAKEDGIHVN